MGVIVTEVGNDNILSQYRRDLLGYCYHRFRNEHAVFDLIWYSDT